MKMHDYNNHTIPKIMEINIPELFLIQKFPI